MPDTFADRLRAAAKRIPGLRSATVVDKDGNASEQSETTMRVMQKATEWGKDLATPQRQAMAKAIMDKIASVQAKENNLRASEEMAGIDSRNWVEKLYTTPMPRSWGQPIVDAQARYDAEHPVAPVDMGDIDIPQVDPKEEALERLRRKN